MKHSSAIVIVFVLLLASSAIANTPTPTPTPRVTFAPVMTMTPLLEATPTPLPGASPTATPTPLPTQEPADGLRNYKTKITGNTVFTDDEIRDVIHHAGPNYFFNRWPFLRRKLPRYAESTIEEDRKRVLSLYQTEGYYLADVQITAHLEPERDRSALFVSVVENEPVFVTSLDLRIAEANATFVSPEKREEYNQKWNENAELQEGKRFSIPRYQQSQNIILRTVGEDGHIRATVSAEADISPREKSADVQMTVSIGPQVEVRRVTILGNEEVDTDEIERRVTIEEGEVLKGSAIQTTQREIYDLNYFRSVIINRRPITPGSHIVDLNITVKEQKFRRFRYSIGYGTDEEFRTSASWSRDHFLSGPNRLEISAYYNALEYGGEVAVMRRFWPIRSMVSTARVFARNETPEAYILEEYGGGGSTVWRPRPIWRFETGIRATRSTFKEISDLDDIALNVSSDLPVREDVPFWHTYILGSASLDRTDNAQNPREGYVVTLYAQSAEEIIGSEPTYYKSTLTLEGFLPLEPPQKSRLKNHFVLAARAKVGLGDATGDSGSILPSERFYTGGGSSVRGYEYQKLGPLSSDNDPLGGSSLLEGNLELRFPLYKDLLGGVVFGDGGNVWPDASTYETDELRYSAGLGLRVYTPIGPVRLDYGYKINPETDDEVKWRVHFSISHTF